MGEIAGARAELDRLGRSLRAQTVELVTELTPGADLDLLFLDEPTVSDRHEPVKYRYSTDFRGERPPGVEAADLVLRGAEMLSAAGWTVTASPADVVPGSIGTKDGSTIEIRATTAHPSVLFSVRTREMSLTEPRVFEWPTPVRTAETVDPGYVLCYECDGLGRCPECGGRGWLPDEEQGRITCPECLGEKVCPICRDAGQLLISRLQTFQRGYYPDLPK
ncbi:hypothetical protein [Nocardia jejuensis]|uniref:hypothetical protein n=1 Tax=Nocardia jejuensis TaxID=328049 RepID=UPI00082C0768|nr:hypothetical protein [Nocardia jejuensis]